MASSHGVRRTVLRVRLPQHPALSPRHRTQNRPAFFSFISLPFFIHTFIIIIIVVFVVVIIITMVFDLILFVSLDIKFSGGGGEGLAKNRYYLGTEYLPHGR